MRLFHHLHNLPCPNPPACLMRGVANCMQDPCWLCMHQLVSSKSFPDLQRTVGLDIVTSQVES